MSCINRSQAKDSVREGFQGGLGCSGKRLTDFWGDYRGPSDEMYKEVARVGWCDVKGVGISHVQYTAWECLELVTVFWLMLNYSVACRFVQIFNSEVFFAIHESKLDLFLSLKNTCSACFFRTSQRVYTPGIAHCKASNCQKFYSVYSLRFSLGDPNPM